MGRLARTLAARILLAFLAAPWPSGPANAAVEASDYDAFWLWGGVRPQPVLAQARTLYILQGQISATRRSARPEVRFAAQGVAIPKPGRSEVWLAYRAHTLRWPAHVHDTLLAQLRRWQRAGHRVVGVQIDFDARTLHLHEYVDFLRDLRRRLPDEYRLSITGLLDWSSNADPAAIGQLKGIVDEVVVQTYQGLSTITDYQAYLPRVSRLGLPFKIGLVQQGEWRAPDYLTRSPWFRGYVVFLRNP